MQMLERARQESVSRANNDLSFSDRNADPTQQRIGVGTAAETKKIDKSGSVGSMQAKEQCGVRKKEEEKKKEIQKQAAAVWNPMRRAAKTVARPPKLKV